MLMDSIKRFDGEKQLKMINIADLQRTHPSVYQQLRAVPALMVLPSKEIIYGKAVFDYLLLPSRGKLVVGTQNNIQQPQPNMTTTNTQHGILHSEEGIMAFNSAKSFSGDSFAYVSDDNATPDHADNNPHGSYNWASIDGILQNADGANATAPQPVATNTPSFGLSSIGIETRQQKEALDIDKLRTQREQDMQSIFTTQTIPI